MQIHADAGVDVAQGAGRLGRVEDALIAGRLGDEGVNGWLETAESDQDARLLDGADIGSGVMSSSRANSSGVGSRPRS